MIGGELVTRLLLVQGVNIMVAAFAVMPPRQFRCRNECDAGDDFTFEA